VRFARSHKLNERPYIADLLISWFLFPSITVVKGSYLNGQYDDLPILNINDPAVLPTIKVMCDSDGGGHSTAHFDIIDNRPKDVPTEAVVKGTNADRPTILQKGENRIEFAKEPLVYGHFHGSISFKLPQNRPEIERSGYAGFRLHDRKRSIFLSKLIDLEPYKYIALRVKSDGHKYFINLMTDSMYETDLHQHRLFTTRPNQWETIVVSPTDFVRTNHGRIFENQQQGILLRKIRNIGISKIDRTEGPYSLMIEKIWVRILLICVAI